MKEKIIIIGGGASGFIAAITAAKKGLSVTILEKKDRVLKRVLATGNGRCNFTNDHLSCKNYYGNDLDFVKKVLERFSTTDCIEFFYNLGILHTTLENGKVYPLSLQASTIVDALRNEAHRLNIEIINNFEVIDVYLNKELFTIVSKDKKKVFCSKLVFAVGGKSYPELGGSDESYSLIENLGHKKTELKPVLVQLKTNKEQIKGLEGIRIDCCISAFSKNKFITKASNDLIFAEYGISGNLVFELSYLTALYNDLVFVVDFIPSIEEENLYNILCEQRKILSHLTCEYFLCGLINKKLAMFLCKKAGIEKLSLPIKELSDLQLHNICKILKNYEINITGTTGFKNAQITAGGFLTNQINPLSMESYLVKNLYLVGEVLDVFGDCGGYNLHWAWASGFIAGTSL